MMSILPGSPPLVRRRRPGSLRFHGHAFCVFIALLGFLTQGAYGDEPTRTWTSADGKFSTKARFLEWDSGKVRLQREDGKAIGVVAASLSEADRLYLSSLDIEAFKNTVFSREGSFRWKVDRKEGGQTEDLAEAIQNAIGEGNREVHLLVGINGGTYNGQALVHYTSKDCWIKAKPVTGD